MSQLTGTILELLTMHRTLLFRRFTKRLFSHHTILNPIESTAYQLHKYRIHSIRYPQVKPRQFSNDASESTIYALSTPPGKSAIAVVRVSGPASLSIYSALCPSRPTPHARTATLRSLYHPQTRDVLDPGALLLYFPAPRTVTGEDVLEMQLHGGPAIVRAVLAAIPLASKKGAIRYAEPGEFTRRAFYNDRLTLPEIETLGQTLDATTEQQRRVAVGGASRALTKKYEQWWKMLVDARGETEAVIDFSEDQGFEGSSGDVLKGVGIAVEQLKARLLIHKENAMRGELLRSGISLAFVGAPNVGKSSLLNRIVGREAAIVSDEAGTTRDVVDLTVDIGGWMVLLGDTAGVRAGDAVGKVEQEGIRRARRRVLDAHVVVAVIEASADGALRIPPDVMNVIREAKNADKEVLVVVNKIDLLPSDSKLLFSDVISALDISPSRIFPISCTASDSTRDGIRLFMDGLAAVFADITTATVHEEDPISFGATQRQTLLVEECIGHLDSFMRHGVEAGEDVDVVLAAEDLRAAAHCLGRITGRGDAGDVEEVLGVVFENFCVGK